MRSLPVGAAIVCMLLVLAGCADPAGAPSPTPGAAPTSTTLAARPGATPVKQRDLHLSGRELNLAVYYLRTWRGRRYLAPEWHPVPYTRAVAAAALGELLAAEPYCPGSRRSFPDGTRLRGIDVGAGTATVELSGSALGALAGRDRRWALQSLVHTLTQFPTVRRVLVLVRGRAVAGPLARDPAMPLAPIALAQPAAGALVKGDRLVVKGEASVYEGTVSLRLRDDQGNVMAQGHATAAEGAPGRGPFSGALSFTPPAASRSWTLEAFEVSAEDGRILYSVQLPVWVGR
jgi:germination protein M